MHEMRAIGAAFGKPILDWINTLFILATLTGVLFPAFGKAQVSESLADLRSGLPSGYCYLIRTTDYFPPQPRFKNVKDAEAWLRQVMTNPPVHIYKYYQLYVDGDAVVMHSVMQNAEGDFVPNTNLFVGISQGKSWTYSEWQNIVTTVTNPVGQLPHEGLLGVFSVGDTDINFLRHLGIVDPDVSSISFLSDSDFKGFTFGGMPLNGTIDRDHLGRITNILMQMNSPIHPYEANISIEPAPDLLAAAVHISNRSKEGTKWHLQRSYEVIKKDPLPGSFDFLTFYQGYTNSQTTFLQFNPEMGRMIWLKKDGPPQIMLDSRYAGHTPLRQFDVLIAFIIASGILGWFLFKASRATKSKSK